MRTKLSTERRREICMLFAQELRCLQGSRDFYNIEVVREDRSRTVMVCANGEGTASIQDLFEMTRIARLNMPSRCYLDLNMNVSFDTVAITITF